MRFVIEARDQRDMDLLVRELGYVAGWLAGFEAGGKKGPDSGRMVVRNVLDMLSGASALAELPRSPHAPDPLGPDDDV